MSDNVKTDAPRAAGSVVAEGFERIWGEIKQISRQVEQETRRSGRSARLRLDIRNLRNQVTEVRARLGKAVYEAQGAHGDDIALHDVEGFAGGVAALDALGAQIAAKEAEIERLRAPSPSAREPFAGSEEVA